MVAQWADETSNYDPLPQLEPFYIFAAIELGDPDQKGWIMNQALRFYDLFRQWHEGKKQPCEPVEALLQYILWYERESAKLKHTVDTSYKMTHSPPMKVLQRVKAFLSSFRVDPLVGAGAYHKPGGKMHGDRVMQIDAHACERCACALEAALVMTDSMDPEQVITIEVTRMELSSFVCYMRELDKQYRYLSMNVKPAKVSVTDGK